ncbi:MAG: lipoyl(octanoyl) transferase LipB [Saprospiraceae bacterium]|nr:lipoyl(octanoyl) transferase LipB [Saprospiraceae bacterium]
MVELDRPSVKVSFRDLGLVPFAEAWDIQTGYHQQLLARKQALRQGKDAAPLAGHHLLFCEHPPVFTMGKSGKPEHLKLPQSELEELGFTYFKINRGGDITYHGPGQIVGYPILDLEEFYCDVHRYVRDLEEVTIRTIAAYGIEGTRIPGYTGVWLAPDGDRTWRKICAIGVHLSRWISLHGFAFNVNTDLSHFDYIIPCGIGDDDKSVTSLSVEYGQRMDMEDVKKNMVQAFQDVFQCEIKTGSTC